MKKLVLFLGLVACVLVYMLVWLLLCQSSSSMERKCTHILSCRLERHIAEDMLAATLLLISPSESYSLAISSYRRSTVGRQTSSLTNIRTLLAGTGYCWDGKTQGRKYERCLATPIRQQLT